MMTRLQHHTAQLKQYLAQDHIKTRMKHAAWCMLLLLPIEIMVVRNALLNPSVPAAVSMAAGNPTPAITYTLPAYVAANKLRVLPNILSQKDVERYQGIFTAMKTAEWKNVDSLASQVENPILMGYVQAERILRKRNDATAEQLAEWLIKYSDHPQAAEIYALALAKNPSIRNDVPEIRRTASLSGYGDDIGLAVKGTPYAEIWQAGLASWKAGRKQEAADYFSSMAKREGISGWKASAAAFWAYRAYHDLGDKKTANSYLRLAAQEPRSFYGILARKKLNQDLDLDTAPVELSDSDRLEMIGDTTIRRIVTLAQVGYGDLAEKELRGLFPQASKEQKPRLLGLANELGLASVQISMAKRLSEEGNEMDFARYPIPKWQPQGGFKIDPLLIFAVARQESGFRTTAVSPGGAQGVMQLMPQTASLMQKQLSAEVKQQIAADHTSDPIANITLGQEYLEHLLTHNMVDGNLFYMLTAYNAGPGRLLDWKASLGAGEDPLLFMETIPIAETRYYVQQVMTNYWIYSELVGSSQHSVYALLHNRWPAYDDSKAGKAVASRNNSRIDG